MLNSEIPFHLFYTQQKPGWINNQKNHEKVVGFFFFSQKTWGPQLNPRAIGVPDWGSDPSILRSKLKAPSPTPSAETKKTGENRWVLDMGKSIFRFRWLRFDLFFSRIPNFKRFLGLHIIFSKNVVTFMNDSWMIRR